MSDPLSIHSTARQATGPTSPRDPHQAIANASQRTGADFDYLLAQARLESGLNPSAKARTSSATGLYQFIDNTWLETLDKHGDAMGLGPMAAAIHSGGGPARVAPGVDRSQIMALRYDPNASALMAGALANDNRAALNGVLGRDPDAAELYMAHFLGAGGAAKFLRQLQANPEASAAALLPGPAAANRSIFYERGGADRSVGQVMSLMRGKMERAMAQGRQDGSVATFAHGPESGYRGFAPPIPQFAPGARSSGPPSANGVPRQPSMADTLRNSFAMTGEAMSPQARERVGSAYAKLRAFNL